MTCGIYSIKNNISGKEYVGSSINVERRMKQHLYRLNKNIHENVILQRSYNKHGKDAFIFTLLEETTRKDKISRERYWVSQLKPEFNIIKSIPDMPVGFYVSEETKRKIGNSNRKYWTDEKRKAFSDSQRGNTYNKGKKLSEETKKKIGEKNSVSLKGKHWSETKRQQMEKFYAENGWKCGYPKSKETRDKIALIQRGYTLNLVSPENIIYRGICNLFGFCTEHNLNYNGIRRLVKGKCKKGHHKGWRTFTEELMYASY